jgi:hypothetical protein
VAVLSKIFLALGFCALTGSVQAAPLRVCPTLANGKWVVVSVHPDENITALSEEEAHAYIGKKISVSSDAIDFAGARCRIAKRSVRYSVGDDFDVPGFPYWITYDCADKSVFVPPFNVGSSCDRIITGLDGWTFKLRRSK